MELPVVSALEFDQIKSSLKNFLKTKTDFTDYDFEGSNLSMLLDVLTYNTLYTSYNVNMASNELNLDTAVLRDNVVSIAKRLGYTSSSYTSAKVIADITISSQGATQIDNYDYITLGKGQVLTATNDNRAYTFVSRDKLEVSTKGKTSVTFKDVELYEGTEYVISYTVDSSNEHQRFFVPNNFVDAETIRVFVLSDPTNTAEREYTKKSTIVNVKNSDEVFFVEEVQDQKYEIIFGDDVIGRKLRDGEVVRIQYIVTSGSKGNNIKQSNFKLSGTFKGLTSSTEYAIPYANIAYTIQNEKSDGGSEYEDIKSIKFRAPRYYASQERTVTVSDYESVIKQIYPNAELVKVVGGETLNPPQFGKVSITIKPIVGESVSFTEKARIIRELNNYKVGSIEVTIEDPLSIEIVAKPTIIYDESKTKNNIVQIESLINEVVQAYVRDISFNNFGGEYSDLGLRCQIKDVDESIKFVAVPIYLKQLVGLDKGVEKRYITKFYTKLNKNTDGEFFVLSEPFAHKNISDPVYIAAFSGCDHDDSLYLINKDKEILDTVGLVDVDTGELDYTIEPLEDIDGTGDTDPINIFVVPEVLDIEFGPEIVPTFTIDDFIIEDVLDGGGDPGDLLDLDNPILPGLDTLPPSGGDPGDGGTGITIIDSPGGGTVRPPLVPPTPPIIPDPEDPDPNDFITIDDYTPEKDPYSCS